MEDEERPKEEKESVHKTSGNVVASGSNLTSDEDDPVESEVRLHHRAVVVAKEVKAQMLEVWSRLAIPALHLCI